MTGGGFGDGLVESTLWVLSEDMMNDDNGTKKKRNSITRIPPGEGTQSSRPSSQREVNSAGKIVGGLNAMTINGHRDCLLL